jgi:class 3 adenylate cyclase
MVLGCAVRAQRRFVARYMGDGVLAYFRYPQAHKNEAEQVVHAGSPRPLSLTWKSVEGLRL